MIRYPNPFQFLRQWGRMLFKSAGSVSAARVLLETGDFVLLETGDKLLLE